MQAQHLTRQQLRQLQLLGAGKGLGDAKALLNVRTPAHNSRVYPTLLRFQTFVYYASSVASVLCGRYIISSLRLASAQTSLHILHGGLETERHTAKQIPYYVPKTVIIF